MEFGEQKAWPLTQSFFRMHVSEGQRVYLYHHGIVYFGYDICFIIKKKTTRTYVIPKVISLLLLQN